MRSRTWSRPDSSAISVFPKSAPKPCGVRRRCIRSAIWDTVAAGDFRAHSPRFQGSNVDANLALVEALRGIAVAQDLSVAQVAIAWVLENPTITSAIVGASKPEQLDQTLPAVDLKLDEQLREACNAIWYQLPHEPNSEIAYR